MFLLVFACHPILAATQVGSAPYRASATGAGNSHSPVFSADGRHVAFVSHANNLVTNDDFGPHLDLFVRDLAASNTVLVSVGTNGFGGANDNIGLYTLSSNAQVVAFDTAANNLAPGDTNRVSDIYVRELTIGTTRLVSASADGSSSANGPSSNPLISEDGRYVIFESLASNLVTNDFNGTNDIFIHDLTTGRTELVSVNAAGTASPDGPSHSPSISADGLAVAFVSHATNLVEGVTNRLGEIYARKVAGRSNLWAQAAHLPETHSRSLASGALEPYRASEPVLNADGRYVAFKTLGQSVRFDLSLSTNALFLAFTNSPQPELKIDFFRFDDNPRIALSGSQTPLAFTRDGRYLAMNTSSNSVPTPGVALIDFDTLATNVFVTFPSGPWSFTTNVSATIRVVLTNHGPYTLQTWKQMPCLNINADATRLMFLADSTNLVASVTNRVFQLYSLDVVSSAVVLLSTNTDNNPGRDLAAIAPGASPSGSLLAWDSPDDDIVDADLNRAWDVFARNVDTGETQVISARHPDLPAASGTALSRLDLNPGALSANGQRLAILSLDNTLAPDDTNTWRDLFVRDLIAGTNIDVGRSTIVVNPFEPRNPTNAPGIGVAAAPSLSADGRFVAFAGAPLIYARNTNRPIYWRDLLAPTNQVVVGENPNSPGGSFPILSPDGRFVAFHTAERLDPVTDVNGTPDIYMYAANFTPADHITRNPFAVSLTNTAYPSTGNGASINPVFSPDSTWVVFQSDSTDLTADPGTASGRYQLFARQFLTDRTNVAGRPTRLISYTTAWFPDQQGTSTQTPLSNGAANPRFSADSRYVAFEGDVNLIYRHDLLGGWVTNVMMQTNPLPSLTSLARFTNDLVCSNCANPALSSEGRFVAYESRPGPGGSTNVFVKDLVNGQVELISVSMSGTNGNGPSFTPLLSHDARFVVFASRASDLVSGDHNRATDIFVRDRFAGVTHCVSRNFAGTGTGDRVSSNPILSADGRTVAFQSFASDIVSGDYNDTRDVFVVTLGGPDTDGDLMDDDWEMAYFSTLARDGSGDFDNDGATDLAEFRAGTNPANDASILRVLTMTTSIAAGADPRRTTVLLWSAVPGKTYRVQFKASLDAAWAAVGADVTAGSTSASLSDTIEASDEPANPHRFYRVLLAQ